MGGNQLELASRKQYYCSAVIVVHDRTHTHQTRLFVCCEHATRIIGVLLLLLLCTAIRWYIPQASPRVVGSDSDGDDYESLATLRAVAIAPFGRHRHTLVLLTRTYLSRTRRAAICDTVGGPL